ncbi:Ribosomal protein S5 domain 2-type fold subgroup [Penicillium waksmanii]|uniref:Ribosomal protein S5 domain 2-type fold subgroup n=1 Tax=Penicillium waksmanii TaxID=69791 RepID=UPI00254885B0|nr:Ribosomal protein S5 domain 2-type fold subgroup [Penicillium waksmanii]KAJ5999849.1 Ribosomal protein S5 domain 2-type fold subgroup [Penicillium waksmanii]
MPIEALPQDTVRAIGSTSVISDPCSVVKELVDNALDASASSISVELSLNTIDVIQVKDNGIGISADDHPGVCRHACTSKIQTVEDLKNIGGTSFGFRGEALASVAEMSGGVTVTTRTTSEVIGSCVKYSREGEILQNQRTAHPVGTTVRVTDFLKHIPVRRQTVLKGTTKAFTKIRKLLQAYAYAQPSCRLSLKFLKAKNESNNWMYVPSPEAAISDAAVKIAGRDASSCCSLKDVSSDVNTQNGSNLTSGTYRLGAFLPRPDIDFSKINHIGQFVSLDGRPLSSSRGISHDIVKLFKSYLRSAASKDGFSKTIVDPFLCLQIECPQGAYDVNIEPGKDDVLFEDREIMLSLAENLLRDFYGQLPVDTKKSPTKDKSTSSNTAGTTTGFNVLMARKHTEGPPANQPANVRELPVSHSTRKPPSHPRPKYTPKILLR